MRLPSALLAALIVTLPLVPAAQTVSQPGAAPPAGQSAMPAAVPMRDPPPSFASLARQLLPSVVNISTTQNLQARADRPDAPETPQAPPGSPFEEFFRDFFNRNRPEQPGRPGLPHAAAPRAVARLGLHHRRQRHRRDQQPRHRRRGRDQRHPQGQHQHPRRAAGYRPTDRPRGAADQDRQAAGRGGIRRQRHGGSGRLGAGHRQPLRPRRHGDGGHRLGPRARHPPGAVRRLHPDRCRHQPRQFRRPAVQPGWQGRRHQHRDLLAFRRVHRHRLLHPVQPGAQHHRAAAGGRQGPPRLAGREHPAGYRRDRRKPRPVRRWPRRAGGAGAGWRPGGRGRHPQRRRHPAVQRPGGAGDAQRCRASSRRPRSAGKRRWWCGATAASRR